MTIMMNERANPSENWIIPGKKYSLHVSVYGRCIRYAVGTPSNASFCDVFMPFHEKSHHFVVVIVVPSSKCFNLSLRLLSVLIPVYLSITTNDCLSLLRCIMSFCRYSIIIFEENKRISKKNKLESNKISTCFFCTWMEESEFAKVMTVFLEETDRSSITTFYGLLLTKNINESKLSSFFVELHSLCAQRQFRDRKRRTIEYYEMMCKMSLSLSSENRKKWGEVEK